MGERDWRADADLGLGTVPVHAILAPILRQDISALLISEDVPFLGPTMLTTPEARVRLREVAVRFVQAQVVFHLLHPPMVQLP